MAAAIALGGFTGPEADTLGYAIRKKKSTRPARPEGEVRHPGGRARRAAGRRSTQVFAAFQPFERYGFNKAHATCYGLIAYQTAYLKANYTVDYMATRALGVPRQRGEGRRGRRRVPPARHRGPAAGRRPQPGRVHGRGRGDPVRPAGGQERRPGRDRVDHRGARGGGPVQVARRPVPADRPAAREPQGARVAGEGRARSTRSGTRRRSSRASTTRSPRAPPRSATSPRARRRCSTSARPSRWSWSGRCPNVARGAGPRAAALGEGAPRPVPVRAPDGRGRRPGRRVRDGLLGRPRRTSRSTASGSSSAGSSSARGRSSPGRARRWPW